MDVDDWVVEGNELLRSEFGFKVEKSKYTIHDADSWDELVKENELSEKTHGIYFPRLLEANIKKDSEFLPLSVFHEYLGHGIYCEHSLVGQKMVFLDQYAGKLEDQIFELQKKNASSENQKLLLQLCAEHSQQKNELLQLSYNNLFLYEGFAMWLESFLAKNLNKNGLKKLFEKEMTKMNSTYSSSFDAIRTVYEEFGSFTLIAGLGFPKHYDSESLLPILKKIYSDEFDSIELCLLYGSKKHYSDIDLFIVSDEINSSYNNWLDVTSMTKKDFEKELSNLSLRVTDPVFSGELVIGSENQLNQIKESVHKTEITDEILKYTEKEILVYSTAYLIYSSDSHAAKTAKSFKESFKKNLEFLKNGQKLLTFEEILKVLS